jgi:DNA-binding PadR family transcriptional regulator
MYPGQLRTMVLMSLHTEATTGYGIIKSIRDLTGYWKPSTGSLYPVLAELAKEGLITSCIKGRKKIFSLTASGEAHLHSCLDERDRLLDQLISHVRLSGHLCKMKESSFMVDMLERIKKNHHPFGSSTGPLISLRDEIMRLIKAGRMEPNNEKVSAIIRKCVNDLRDIK